MNDSPSAKHMIENGDIDVLFEYNRYCDPFYPGDAYPILLGYAGNSELINKYIESNGNHHLVARGISSRGDYQLLTSIIDKHQNLIQDICIYLIDMIEGARLYNEENIIYFKIIDYSNYTANARLLCREYRDHFTDAYSNTNTIIYNSGSNSVDLIRFFRKNRIPLDYWQLLVGHYSLVDKFVIKYIMGNAGDVGFNRVQLANYMVLAQFHATDSKSIYSCVINKIFGRTLAKSVNLAIRSVFSAIIHNLSFENKSIAVFTINSNTEKIFSDVVAKMILVNRGHRYEVYCRAKGIFELLRETEISETSQSSMTDTICDILGKVYYAMK